MSQPILSSRPSDEISNLGRNDPEEPLLNGRSSGHKQQIRGDKWTQLALLVWAVVATAGEFVRPGWRHTLWFFLRANLLAV